MQPGRNDVRVIVRDPFGNRSELATQTYYGGSPRLLAKGLDEYAVRIGAPRDGGGLGGGYDDQLAYQAWYRRGLSDWFTLGGRVEGDEYVRNGGLDAAVRTPLGEFAFAWAGSERDVLGRGHAHAVNYSFNMRTLVVRPRFAPRRSPTTARSSDPLRRPASARCANDDYASFSFSPRNAACRCNSTPAASSRERAAGGTHLRASPVRCARGIAASCSSPRSAANRTCSKTPPSS